MGKKATLHLALAAAIGFVAAPAAAQEAAPATNVVSQTVQVRPMPGQGAAFEAGVKAYMSWALEAGNDWTWLCWEVIAGNDTGEYRFGTYNHEWADFDSPPVDPAQTGAAIDQHIAPHVRDVVTTFAARRADLSNYSRTSPAPMYMVYEHQVKVGKVEQFEAAMKQYHDLIVEHAPQVEYVVHQLVLGGETGRYMLALPMEGMGTMGEMPNLDAIMREALGDDAWQALSDDYFDSIVAETSSVVVLRRDLSLNAPQ